MKLEDEAVGVDMWMELLKNERRAWRDCRAWCRSGFLSPNLAESCTRSGTPGRRCDGRATGMDERSGKGDRPGGGSSPSRARSTHTREGSVCSPFDGYGRPRAGVAGVLVVHQGLVRRAVPRRIVHR